MTVQAGVSARNSGLFVSLLSQVKYRGLIKFSKSSHGQKSLGKIYPITVYILGSHGDDDFSGSGAKWGKVTIFPDF